MASRAKQYFDLVLTNKDPAGFLRKLVDDKKQENEFLEFKGVGKIKERDIKSAWSEALSGFANTEGGVLIWGIKAKPMQEDGEPRAIDTAVDLDLAVKPGSLAQLLKDVLLEASVEAINGVEIVPVEAQADGAGFVVCYVPEGSHKPYRAQLCEQQYYHRVGGKCVALPHSLLRSLFYPRAAPNLQVYVKAKYVIDGGGRFGIKFDGRLVNLGVGTALDLCVSLGVNREVEVVPEGNPVWRNISQQDGAWWMQGLMPLHPSQDVFLFRGTWWSKTHHEPRAAAEARLRQWEPDLDSIWFSITAYMRDQTAVCLTVQFTKGDLKDNSTVASTPATM